MDRTISKDPGTEAGLQLLGPLEAEALEMAALCVNYATGFGDDEREQLYRQTTMEVERLLASEGWPEILATWFVDRMRRHIESLEARTGKSTVAPTAAGPS